MAGNSIQANPTLKLNPAKLQLYDKGAYVHLLKAFKLIYDGVNVPSNTLFDPVFMNPATVKLPEDVKYGLEVGWLLTSTLIVKNKNGKKLDDGSGKIVFSSDDWSVTFIVNKAYRYEYGLVADLVQGNFGFELSKDGMHATIYQLNEQDAKLLKFGGFLGWAKANESTLWVPAESISDGKGQLTAIDKTLDGAPTDDRLFDVPSGVVVNLALRGEVSPYDDITRKIVSVDQQFCCFPLLENTENMGAVAEKKETKQPE